MTSINNRRNNSNNVDKIILKPCPPMNPDCQCTEFYAPEGKYTLLHDIFLDSIQPQYTTGTHISLFSSVSKSPSIPSTAPPTPGIKSQQHYLHLPSAETQLHHNHSFSSCTNTTSTGTNASLTEEDGEIENELHETENTALPIVDTVVGSAIPAFITKEFIEQQTNSSNSYNTSSTSSGNGSFSSFFSSSNKQQQQHRKPKNSLSKLKSSFIDYVTMHDSFGKLTSTVKQHLFFNVGLSLVWMAENQPLQLPKEIISRLTFGKAYVTCHDVNYMTSNSAEHINMIIGFSTGDFLWYDTISNRYTRLNKNGIMNSSTVTMVKWIPDSEDLFMASFDDGSVLILDKEREDQAYILPEPQTWAEEHFQITKSNKGSKYNPVAHWRVSHKGITAFSFSPDGSHIAMVGKDGLMRVIDYVDERLCDVFVGYFGRMSCVAWSPDGRYILTGGQDDIVTIWSFTENKIVARCRGHRSWVTGVAFDPLQCDGKNYRFGSVGEDCNLLLWDFSVSALHRSKHKHGKPAISAHEMNNRSVVPLRDSLFKRKSLGSTASPFTMAVGAVTTSASTPLTTTTRRFRKRASIFGNNTPNELTTLQPIEHVRLPTIHPALSKGQVPYLQPITRSTIHPDPCVDIVFREDAILTTDRRGRVRIWSRPRP